MRWTLVANDGKLRMDHSSNTLRLEILIIGTSEKQMNINAQDMLKIAYDTPN